MFMDASSMTSELNSTQQSKLLSELSNLTGGINLMQIFVSFIFYFLAGYLMYSSLFAAVGSAVDAEADTQQFVLPITIPLILAFIMIQPIMENPDGPLAFWMSIIPFTSPVIMMVRLPFGVANWELALSMAVLILSFILTTYLAGKIYRTGILMYGKKPSYKELWKWLFY
jgi:ABC-2 type transport system permease protein